MRWDPAAYGDAFADVYDEWYGTRQDEDDVVGAVGRVLGSRPAGRVIELGVGTGRLALPLAAAGWEVVGLDASADMLTMLRAKGAGIIAVLGDAAEPTDYPAGPFDAVVAAYNFVFNLPDVAAQHACLAAAAAVSRSNGALFVEADVPHDSPRTGPVESDGPVDGVHVLTEADPDAGIVVGEHRDDRGTVRRWHVRPVAPDELDASAARAGWTLRERWGAWDGRPFDPVHSDAHVSIYRLAP